MKLRGAAVEGLVCRLVILRLGEESREICAAVPRDEAHTGFAPLRMTII